MQCKLIFLFTFCSFSLFAQTDSILSKIDLAFDYRFRVEQDWDSRKSEGSFREDRTRLRYRLRAGASYKHNKYSIGFRIRTGDPNKQQDPQLTIGKAWKEFGTLPIGFEKAYFQYQGQDFSFWLGKNSYPFKKSNELFWSDNVFTEGIAVRRKFSKGLDIDLIAGHFILASNDGSFLDDAYFQGVQTVFATKNKSLEIFPSMYWFRNIPDIPDGGHTFLMNYSIVHLGGRYKPLFAKRFSLELDYYQNLADYEDHAHIHADWMDQKRGYTIGVQYGNIKVRKNWMFKWTYTYLERYAILDYMAQNDWARWDYSAYNSPDGRLSNMRGMEVVVAYAISEKVNLVSKYYLVEQLVPFGIAKETGQRIRFDLNIRL